LYEHGDDRPLGLAQDWDNVGLLAGDPAAAVRRVLVCVDLTADVVAEAGRRRAQMVVAYHPPLFKPVSRLNAAGPGTDAHVFACVARGIAIYSPHTALDAAEGGTNDVLAGLCRVRNPAPIEFVDSPGPRECKLVVFVPSAEVYAVAEAMFAAGAGTSASTASVLSAWPGRAPSWAPRIPTLPSVRPAVSNA